MHEKRGLNSRRACAECDSRFCPGRSFLSSGGPGGRAAPRDYGGRRRSRRGPLHARDSVPAAANAGWPADDGRGFYNRRSVADQLGRAAAARSRLDSRGAHRGRIRGEGATGRGGGDLLFCGKEAGGLALSYQPGALPLAVPFLPALAIDSRDDHRLKQFPRPRILFLLAFGDASAHSVARIC
ncbi:hypothetical protein SBA7_110021 [Candidatus Sulfotelmatobacter sp. SbA7]|nr:hypothetical protein SBA7_110021 [Candidatus Sulfotelmatobacter sp. SbA7]